jgi:hypothetical protein
MRREVDVRAGTSIIRVGGPKDNHIERTSAVQAVAPDADERLTITSACRGDHDQLRRKDPGLTGGS